MQEIKSKIKDLSLLSSILSYKSLVHVPRSSAHRSMIKHVNLSFACIRPLLHLRSCWFYVVWSVLALYSTYFIFTGSLHCRWEVSVSLSTSILVILQIRTTGKDRSYISLKFCTITNPCNWISNRLSHIKDQFLSLTYVLEKSFLLVSTKFQIKTR